MQVKMSKDEKSNRKEKKAQRDAERQKKGKKRKHGELEEQDEAHAADELKKDFIPLDTGADNLEAVGKDITPSKSESRKRKAEQGPNITSDAPSSKSKKRRKTKSEKTQNADGAEQKAPAEGTKSRFILFIGNLPYSTTDATLNSHFKKISPFTLRHRTDPKTKKSKGFAFLEFENYDRMKTCLKLYHHSMFDPAKTAEENGEMVSKDGKKGDKGGRRINVELTVGGGGKAEGRKEKIKVKNVRLDEQRKRRAELERKENEKKVKKEVKGVNGVAETPQEKVPETIEAGGDGSGMGMHPSRLARMKN